ncbi:MAG: hypothetical protein WA700_01830 [Acidobacteriaceae bacterium]
MMGELKSEYPTNEQIAETLEAYRKGGDALMELILKRRAAETDDGQLDAPSSRKPSGS